MPRSIIIQKGICHEGRNPKYRGGEEAYPKQIWGRRFGLSLLPQAVAPLPFPALRAWMPRAACFCPCCSCVGPRSLRCLMVVCFFYRSPFASARPQRGQESLCVYEQMRASKRELHVTRSEERLHRQTEVSLATCCRPPRTCARRVTGAGLVPAVCFNTHPYGK